eukprot:Gregarina_sp_Poly_1__2884@NODE_1803_length_3302_cov_190_013910_g689_i1_p6_GENE_NODE_1803_length_3302_cov_190_013910_g689_i1NODE_1803_length_3302_cov_190_013910_g689_i1_p6_ORF_typecomplete_len115_score37_18Ribosomal_60s/PF00428_19/2_6e22Sporozoite_P67/PF05642_11/0_017DUF3824/PF12868_7/0_047FHIPEP/PF00771_20/0_04_NODE_1803_length_3302_cov_190_013910_g689_i116491993
MALKHVAAMMLCHYAGTTISVDALKKVIGAIGGDFEEDIARQLVQSVEGKDINEVLSIGLGKLSAAPVAGAGTVAASTGGAAAAAGAAAEEKEEKKEEEEQESEDDDMGFGLFD